jgi:hypothetical protein
MCGYMSQPLCGHPQAVKVNKNQNYNYNINLGGQIEIPNFGAAKKRAFCNSKD